MSAGKDKEAMQEDEYDFPYHHLVDAVPFTEARHLFWGYEYAAYLERILGELGARPFKSLIDIGCGDGKLLFEVSKKYPERRLVGTDFSEKALAFARAFSPSVVFQKDIPEETFDAFTLIEVIEHIPPEELDAFLALVAKRLAPGGFGIITTPSDNIPTIPKHYRHFNEELIRSVLEPHFVVEEVSFLTKKSFWVKILQSILANRFFILNHQGAKNALYKTYVSGSLNADSRNGSRVMAIVRSRLPS